MINPVIISDTHMKELADGVVHRVKRDRDIGGRARVKWDSFADGWPKLRIENVESIRDQDVVYIASFHSPAVLFENMAVIYALPRYQCRTLSVILPYYPVGTMERVDEGRSGDIATAMTMARVLSAIPSCFRGGPPMITIFDIHALQERFYFSDAVIPDLRTSIGLLNRKLASRDPDDWVVVFPDEGARKRYDRIVDQRFERVICEKVRDGSQRRINIKSGNPKNKHAVIIDDLIMSGRTIHACREQLDRWGAFSVSVYAAHGVFPRDSWKDFTRDKYDTVWITDSCPQTATKVKDTPPFVVLSLDELIANIINNER